MVPNKWWHKQCPSIQNFRMRGTLKNKDVKVEYNIFFLSFLEVITKDFIFLYKISLWFFSQGNIYSSKESHYGVFCY